MSKESVQEVILLKSDDAMNYICPCGNDCMGDGFEPCNVNGEIVEPTVNSDWDGRYVCLDCGRVHQVKK